MKGSQLCFLTLGHVRFSETQRLCAKPSSVTCGVYSSHFLRGLKIAMGLRGGNLGLELQDESNPCLWTPGFTLLTACSVREVRVSCPLCGQTHSASHYSLLSTVLVFADGKG